MIIIFLNVLRLLSSLLWVFHLSVWRAFCLFPFHTITLWLFWYASSIYFGLNHLKMWVGRLNCSHSPQMRLWKFNVSEYWWVLNCTDRECCALCMCLWFDLSFTRALKEEHRFLTLYDVPSSRIHRFEWHGGVHLCGGFARFYLNCVCSHIKKSCKACFAFVSILSSWWHFALWVLFSNFSLSILWHLFLYKHWRGLI